MKLGEFIKAYRERNHMSMQAFADKAHLSKGYISMLEKHKHPQNKRPLTPSLKTYQKVASATNLSLDELIAALDDDESVNLSNTENDYILCNDEMDLLSAYRSLNPDGQHLLTDYADTLVASGKYDPIRELNADIPRNAVAAHDRTDIDATDEMRKFDDEIMEDDDF